MTYYSVEIEDFPGSWYPDPMGTAPPPVDFTSLEDAEEWIRTTKAIGEGFELARYRVVQHEVPYWDRDPKDDIIWRPDMVGGEPEEEEEEEEV